MRRRSVPNAIRNPFTAVLIAGGRSTRMGRDKAALVVDGQPLWQRQFDILRSLDPAESFISGPLDGPWSGTEVEIVPDQNPGAGPLEGLATALTQMRTERLLVLAVDLPAMSADFLRGLLADCAAAGGLVPQLDGLFEPLAAIYPRALRGLVRSFLESGERSLQPVIRAALEQGMLDCRRVAESERGFFLNLNTPADFARHQRGH